MTMPTTTDYETQFELTFEASGAGAGGDANVRWVQNALNRALNLRLATDGAMGPATRSAIRLFQQRKGLAADGVAGAKTMAALRSATGQSGPSAGNVLSGVGNVISGVGSVIGGVMSCAAIGQPCDVLDGFAFDRDAVPAAQQAKAVNAARCLIARQGGTAAVKTLSVVGHTDKVGPESYNVDLGRRRAANVARQIKEAMERMQPGSSSGVTFAVDSRGATKQVSADPARNRRVEICFPALPPPPPPPPPVPATRTFTVVAKSSILPVGFSLGIVPCATNLLPPDPDAELRLAAFAVVLDQSVHDSVSSDVKDQNYRLFSKCTLSVTCPGNNLPPIIAPSAIDTDVGLECLPTTSACLTPPALTVTPVSISAVGGGAFLFSWTAKGRPHNLAEPAFQLVCPRTSRFIWHRVTGRIDCSGGQPRLTGLKIVGSQFPTHRAFVNGTPTPVVPQGDFANLWNASSSDPSMVE
jgi:hypothetical protein